MSDDPIVDAWRAAVSHSGWFVALLSATWGIVLRALIGRYQRHTSEQQMTLKDIQTTLYDIAGRVTWIEGRIAERDRSDPPPISRRRRD